MKSCSGSRWAGHKCNELNKQKKKHKKKKTGFPVECNLFWLQAHFWVLLGHFWASLCCWVNVISMWSRFNRYLACILCISVSFLKFSSAHCLFNVYCQNCFLLLKSVLVKCVPFLQPPFPSPSRSTPHFPFSHYSFPFHLLHPLVEEREGTLANMFSKF